jgi:hypothetical protein
MNDNNPIPNLGNLVLILATVGWGIVAIHGSLDSSRPNDSGAASHTQASPQRDGKVLSRLWQDPFEPFESSTNQDEPSLEPTSRYFLGVGANVVLRGKESHSDGGDYPAKVEGLWTNIVGRHPDNDNIAILGVLLPGGPYREDKEVRMRLRYAVELALLATNLGPEDGTHIFTNSVVLCGSGSATHIAYERFNDDRNPTNHACAVWLNEDDFGADFWTKLNSLLSNMPPKASFFLIGPHSSDTLRGMVQDTIVEHPDSAAVPCLTLLAKAGRFKILSPEATAEVCPTNPPDPFKRRVRAKINNCFQTDIFHNWIATDISLAGLIAHEVKNRLYNNPLLSVSNNVVAIITEQDTFYGRTIVDALTESLGHIQGVDSSTNVWQFSYLQGLDGWKPPKESSNDTTQEQSTETPTTPEAALQAALQKQMQGETADGNAQLDYIVRLGAFLKGKDKNLTNGRRIIAIGITGTDIYDKLILLQGLRQKFPEAIFFTTDLDASLYNRAQFKFTHNLLVASAYPLDPSPTNSDWRFAQQFAPFRDVYQAAVFRACQAAATSKWTGRGLDANPRDLPGRLYEIGRHGPIELSTPDDATGKKESYSAAKRPRLVPPRFLLVTLFAGLLSIVFAKARQSFVWMKPCGLSVILSLALVTPLCLFYWNELNDLFGELVAWRDYIGCGAGYGAVAILAWGWLYRGIRPWKWLVTSSSLTVRSAWKADRDYRMSLWAPVIGAAIGSLFGLFIAAAERISSLPGEEPWDIANGVSIWPCEFLRLSAAIAGVLFLWYAYRLHQNHRERLWCEYFGKDYDSPNLRRLPKWKSSELRVKLTWVLFWRRGRPEFFRAIGDWPPFRSRIWCKRFLTPLFFWWDTGWKHWFPNPGTSRKSPAEPAVCFHPWRSWLPLVDDAATHPEKPSLDAVLLCKEYLRLGLLPVRFVRVFIGCILYAFIAVLTTRLLHGTPTLLLIRGPLSHQADSLLTVAASLPFLFLLFYVLDTSRLTARLLDSLSLYPTRWPENLLHETAANKGVQEKHLDGWIDVHFAAVQTEEIGKLMLFPFLVLLLILISRNPYFDDWTWPVGLSGMFAVLFFLAGTSWAVVRKAARAVREAGLKELDSHIAGVKAAGVKTFDVSTPEFLEQFNQSVCLGTPLPAVQTIRILKKEYLRRLKSLRKTIDQERRGAYSPWIQDPTYLALFVPTGITGILTVLVEFWLNK